MSQFFTICEWIVQVMTATFSAYEQQCSSRHIDRVRSRLRPRKSLISSINSQIHQPRTIMMEEGTDKDIYMLKPKKTCAQACRSPLWCHHSWEYRQSRVQRWWLHSCTLAMPRPSLSTNMCILNSWRVMAWKTKPMTHAYNWTWFLPSSPAASFSSQADHATQLSGEMDQCVLLGTLGFMWILPMRKRSSKTHNISFANHFPCSLLGVFNGSWTTQSLTRLSCVSGLMGAFPWLASLTSSFYNKEMLMFLVFRETRLPFFRFPICA